MAKPKLSICCICFNHAPYLRQAIDSVLKQNVDFDFEIIIGDDCSTDGSQQILQEYVRKYPKLIKLILQPINTGGKKNFNDVYHAASGKYMIVLETDDFWTNDEKLKIQVNFLEQHPECIAVAHNCTIVDKDNRKLDKKYPCIKYGWYEYKHFMYGLMPGQTTTLMYRNFILDSKFDSSLWNSETPGPGDIRKVFSLLAHGKIFTLPLYMSAYRHVINNGSSFSANHKRNDIKALNYYMEFQEYAGKFNNKKMTLSADVRVFQTALGAFMRKHVNLRDLLSYLSICQYPFKTLFYSLYNICKIKFFR